MCQEIKFDFKDVNKLVIVCDIFYELILMNIIWQILLSIKSRYGH